MTIAAIFVDGQRLAVIDFNRRHGLDQGTSMRNVEREYSYTVVLEPETNAQFAGYYNARVPALPGCFSYGATRDEALVNIREAVFCYLEDLKIHGEPVPEDIPPCLERVNVAL